MYKPKYDAELTVVFEETPSGWAEAPFDIYPPAQTYTINEELNNSNILIKELTLFKVTFWIHREFMNDEQMRKMIYHKIC